MFRSLIVLTLCLSVAGVSPAPADPVRTGFIAGGYFLFAGVAPTPGPDCRWNADCLAWLQARCPAQLADTHVGLHSNIVDVHALAGRKVQRRFTIEPVGTPLLVWGGVSIQFWSASCEHLRKIGGEPPCCKGIRRHAVFRIPARARWMTVASSDSTALEWRLA